MISQSSAHLDFFSSLIYYCRMHWLARLFCCIHIEGFAGWDFSFLYSATMVSLYVYRMVLDARHKKEKDFSAEWKLVVRWTTFYACAYVDKVPASFCSVIFLYWLNFDFHLQDPWGIGISASKENSLPVQLKRSVGGHWYVAIFLRVCSPRKCRLWSWVKFWIMIQFVGRIARKTRAGLRESKKWS